MTSVQLFFRLWAARLHDHDKLSTRLPAKETAADFRIELEPCL